MKEKKKVKKKGKRKTKERTKCNEIKLYMIHLYDTIARNHHHWIFVGHDRMTPDSFT